MARTKDESAGSEDAVELNILAKKLQDKRPKDVLVKLLKEAGQALERLPQDEPSKHISGSLASVLKKKALLDHADKDVRICCAFCICQLLRVYAPDSPYTDRELQDVFALLLSVLRLLLYPSAPSFQPCLAILEVLSQVKCCLLLWDFEDDTVVCDLFEVLLQTISEENAKAVEPALLEILVSMVEESESLSQQILDKLLAYLLKPASEEHPAAYRVVQHLLQRTERWFQPHLQKFLINVILDNKVDTSLDDPQCLLAEIHQACPQILLPLLPYIVSELQTERPERRIAAVDLLTKAYSDSPSMMIEYDMLFNEYLRRCCDKQADVRKHVVNLLPRVVPEISENETRDQVMRAMADRLQDADEHVRVAAVAALCSAMGSDLELLSQEVLLDIGDRLRDRKANVRKETASQLLNLFRTYCLKSHGGHDVLQSEELLLWIPPRLIDAALRDPELASHFFGHLIRGGLFPPKLPARDAARQFAAIYAQGDKEERENLLRPAKNRQVFQQWLLEFLSLRSARSDAVIPDRETRLERSLLKLASAFPQDAKVQDGLMKISQMRDNHIFRGLQQLCEPSLSLEEATNVSKDVTQRVGSKGAVGDVMRKLSTRLAPQIISTSLVEGLLDIALFDGVDDVGAFYQAVLDVLVAVSQRTPSLFKTLSKKVGDLVLNSENFSSEQTTAIMILEYAGKYIKFEGWDEVQDKVLSLCRAGSVKLAKHAVRALVTIVGVNKASALLKPVVKEISTAFADGTALVDSNLCIMLQVVSSVGRCLPNLFSADVHAFSEFVMKVLLMSDPEDFSDKFSGASGDSLLLLPGIKKHWERVSPSIRIKAFGLKALAQAVVPDGQPHLWEVSPPGDVSSAIDLLIEQLAGMMDPSIDMEELQPTNDLDRGYLRLVAACAMLRLARGHDARIQSEVYFSLALTMQDTMADVRASFALKLRRTLLVLQSIPGSRAAKYAAMLPLAGVDPSAPNRENGLRALLEWVHGRRRATAVTTASLASQSAAGGTVLQEYPDFLLVYLVQILAHHPDFPDPTEEDFSSEAYQPFVTMLQCALEPLLHSWQTSEPSGATLPAILRIMRTLKNTVDVTEIPATENIYIVADMAIAIANAIFKRVSSDGVQPPKFPGLCPLPKSFYRATEGRSQGKSVDGSHLPEGWQLILANDVLPLPCKARPRPLLKKGPDKEIGHLKDLPSHKRKKESSEKSIKKPRLHPGRQTKRPSQPQAHDASTSEDGNEPESMSDGSLFEGEEKAKSSARGGGIAKSTKSARESGKQSPLVHNSLLPQGHQTSAKQAPSDELEVMNSLQVKGRMKQSAETLQGADGAEKKRTSKRARAPPLSSPDSVRTTKPTSNATAHDVVSPQSAPDNPKSSNGDALAARKSPKAVDVHKTSASGEAKRGPRNRPPKGFLSQAMARTKELPSEQKDGFKATLGERDNQLKDGRADRTVRAAGNATHDVAQGKGRPRKKSAGEQKGLPHVRAQKVTAAQPPALMQVDSAQKLDSNGQRTRPLKGCGIMTHRRDDMSSSGVEVPVEDEAHIVEHTSPVRRAAGKSLDYGNQTGAIRQPKVGRSQRLKRNGEGASTKAKGQGTPKKTNDAEVVPVTKRTRRR
eukprot:jgi/Botrbrau1/5171/Bobra.0172s0043.2